jgi:hypothetical protein
MTFKADPRLLGGAVAAALAALAVGGPLAAAAKDDAIAEAEAAIARVDTAKAEREAKKQALVPASNNAKGRATVAANKAKHNGPKKSHHKKKDPAPGTPAAP